MTGWLYRCYDTAGELLYVGITERPWGARFKEHAQTAPWWHEVASISTQLIPDHLLVGAEALAVAMERPRHNLPGLTELCATAPARALASREIPPPVQPRQDLATRPAAPASDLDPSGRSSVRRYQPPPAGGGNPPDDRTNQED